MQKISILGYGEVGKAIGLLYSQRQIRFYVRDLTISNGDISETSVLNVCIPYVNQQGFVDAVSKAITDSGAKLVIIHSTVAVGTTRHLSELFKQTPIVHSPVRGVHPNLYEGLLTFPKLIGSVSEEATKLAKQHLFELGVYSHSCRNPETPELAKLLDTTYYGACIAFHGEAAAACKAFDADFEDAMTFFNETYNAGYTALGKKNVVRPVLYPPKEKIGGHCVVPNAVILNDQFNSELFALIAKYTPKS